MSRTSSVSFELKSSDGQQVGELFIEILPNRNQAGDEFLFDYRDDATYMEALEPVQVVEGGEYRYRAELQQAGASLHLDKQELFAPDDNSGQSGRFKTGLYVGGLQIAATVNGQPCETIKLEILSKKLDYKSHYRWMLRDISSAATEIIMRHFSPVLQTFKPDTSRGAETIYQRFAFLYTLITGSDFEVAISQIISSPHRLWIESEYQRPIGMGIRGGSKTIRALTSSGRRVLWNDSSIPSLTSLPSHISAVERYEAINTNENRFIKFALLHWRSTAATVQSLLEVSRRTYAVERGLKEVSEVLTILDQILANDFFTEVESLHHFPESSTVLHRKEGYREIFYAYLQSEVAAQLSWEGGEDVYGAGQRDVATLYEIWAFFQIAQVVGSLCSEQVDFSELIQPTSDGLSILIKKGKRLVVRGKIERLKRHLSVELYFNRTFSRQQHSPVDGSWSRTMRPDYSIKFELEPQIGSSKPEVIWLHFDAKYRIDKVSDIFGDENNDDELLLSEELLYKNADLLVMHAYRDAVRHSEGAYVLFPGNSTQPYIFPRFLETIPSIGAFPLRPDENTNVFGNSLLREFLNGVIDNLALQSSQNERGRFWNRKVYESSGYPVSIMNAVDFLSYPPLDTQVVLAFTTSQAVYEWAISNAWLPVSDIDEDREMLIPIAKLSADFVLLVAIGVEARLWKLKGTVKLFNSTELATLNFPDLTVTQLLALQLDEMGVTIDEITDSAKYMIYLPDKLPEHKIITVNAITLGDLLSDK